MAGVLSPPEPTTRTSLPLKKQAVKEQSVPDASLDASLFGINTTGSLPNPP
jgi:hypothetical protein